jgi:hypothetical protein
MGQAGYRRPLLLSLLFLLWLDTASAENITTDTIALTGGQVRAIPAFADATFQLFGPNFSVMSGGPFSLSAPSDLIVGRPIDLSGRFIPHTANAFTYQGQPYGDIGPRGTGVFGQLFAAPTTDVVPGAGCTFSHTNCYNARTPFVMTGQASGFLLGPRPDPTTFSPEVSLTLIGAGTATGFFVLHDAPNDPLEGRWELGRIEYTFAPIPEPSTLLLLMAGAAGLLVMERLFA